MPKYETPKFGTFERLKMQSGIQKLNKLMEEDEDIKLALKDILHHHKQLGKN